MPDEPEVGGLLALMLVQHARSAARFDDRGDLVLLEHQDRSRWDTAAIREGSVLLEASMRRRSIGPYQLQAAIAALHGEAATFDDTDWKQIAALYGVLGGIDPSPVVALNRAVALGFADGPAAGLEALDEIEPGRLPRTHLLAAARGEFLARLGRPEAARAAFVAALSTAGSATERRHLERRITAMSTDT
jgi:RNA polymerase sigma-70 factor (ECF subfamily)